MKFAFAKEHLDFFYQHHYIEFEDLLTSDEIDRVKKGMTETLSERLHTPQDRLNKHNLKTLYLAGFDSWRDSDAIKKIVLRPHFAEIASNLVKKKPLRIGFDQIFCTPPDLRFSQEEMPPLFKQETSLSQTSCLQGIACGLILHLSSPVVPAHTSELLIQEDVQALIPIPRQAGSGIFFSPEMPFSLQHLMMVPDVHQLLISYVADPALYWLNKKDPHTHEYKKLGYAFGDKLKNNTHPILYRG